MIVVAKDSYRAVWFVTNVIKNKMNSKNKAQIENKPCPKNHKNIFDYSCHPSSNWTKDGIQLKKMKGS